MPELTPQQKLLEKLYRESTAKKPPNLQQKKVERAYNKASGSHPERVERSTRSRIKGQGVAQTGKVKTPRARNLESVKKAREVINNAKATTASAKPSAAQNISKFGGGVKARFAPTINAAKTVAVKNGARASTLGRLLGNSRFLAGANSVPGLALGTAAYVIWKKNIEDIYKLYGKKPPWLNYGLPVSSTLINLGSPPPFLGGQSTGVLYRVVVRIETYNYAGRLMQVGDYERISVRGRIVGAEAGRGVDPPMAVVRIVTDPPAAAADRANLVITVGGVYDTAKFIAIVAITRQDGLPDTGGNPPGGTEGEYSQGGTNITNITNVTNVTNVTNITNLAKDTTTVNNIPPAQVINNYYADPTTEPKTESVPTIVPQTVPLLDDNTDKEPKSPTDSPPVKTEDQTADNTSKKPKTASSITTQRYPRSQIEFDEIQKVIEEDRIKNRLNYDSPLEEKEEDIVIDKGWYSFKSNIFLRDAAKKAGFDVEEKEEDIVIDKGWYSFKPNMFLRNVAKKAGFDVEELPSTRITKSPQARRITSTPTVEKTNTDAETGTTVTTKVNEPKTNTPTPTKVETSNFPTPTQIAVAVGGLDILRQIRDKPTPNPTCLAPVYVPPVGAQAKLNGKAIATLQGVTITQSAFIQKAVNAVGVTTTTTMKAVTHSKYGLQAIQNFADTAWKSTRADKVLGVVNTALNIHNAVMLSNALGSTLNVVANQVLEVAGVTDATTGNPINVGSVIKGKLNAIISSIIGANNYAALTSKIRTYNRIYQAGANVLYNVRSIIDSTQDIAETTGENVSQIGNALRKAGAVRENAYSLMPTDFRSTSRVQRRLEKLGEGASVIEEITSEAVDLKDEVKEMKDNSKEFQDELAKERDKQVKAEKIKKDNALNTPEPLEEDEARAIEPEKK